MRKIVLVLAAVFAAWGCSKPLTATEREEARRGELELQSVMDMVSKRQVPPIDFELGSARLKETSFELLDKIAEVLIHHPKLKLIVSGHTDDTGSAAFNEQLSLERAGAVKLYLARKGVYPETVRVYGYGETQPVVKGDTEEARALNRRVEFRITTRDWATVY
jgi:outer membrane protein OmpA-like peptidoglycan-associated protein